MSSRKNKEGKIKVGSLFRGRTADFPKFPSSPAPVHPSSPSRTRSDSNLRTKLLSSSSGTPRLRDKSPTPLSNNNHFSSTKKNASGGQIPTSTPSTSASASYASLTAVPSTSNSALSLSDNDGSEDEGGRSSFRTTGAVGFLHFLDEDDIKDSGLSVRGLQSSEEDEEGSSMVEEDGVLYRINANGERTIKAASVSKLVERLASEKYAG